MRVENVVASIGPGETFEGFSRGSVVGFTNDDYVAVSAVSQSVVNNLAGVEVVSQTRGFYDGTSDPTIVYTLKNHSNVAVNVNIYHLIA